MNASDTHSPAGPRPKARQKARTAAARTPGGPLRHLPHPEHPAEHGQATDPTPTPQRPVVKPAQGARNERLMNTIVNLVYGKPQTADDLARQLRTSSVHVKAALEVLLDERRVYETRSRRKTSVHAIVLGRVQAAAPTTDDRAARLRMALARTPHRKFTANDLSRNLNAPLDETLAVLNTGILDGWVTFVNIGALRVYGLRPDH